MVGKTLCHFHMNFDLATAASLADDATEFLEFKRAMGMGYRRAEFTLNGFVRFVLEQYGQQAVPLDQAVTRWATPLEGRKAITVGNEFGVVRQMCLFRRRSDPRAFVPEHAVAPVKESVFMPYIFSRDEVLALIEAATRHADTSGKPHPRTAATSLAARQRNHLIAPPVVKMGSPDAY